MKLNLTNKYVVLSGASGGIGRELALLLVREYGAKVIGIARNEEKLLSLKKQAGEAFEYFVFDVSVRDNWICFAERLREREITPTLLINNAGVFPVFNKAVDVSSEIFENIMKTNFFSCVYAIEALLPLLKESSIPAVYNVCSSSALCSVAGTAAYSASKSAMKGYTESLVSEGKGKLKTGIVFPGTTATGLFRNEKRIEKIGIEKIATSPEKMAKKILRRIIRLKKRSVIGWDAHLMSGLYRLCPQLSSNIIAWFMKKFGKVVFEDVFDY